MTSFSSVTPRSVAVACSLALALPAAAARQLMQSTGPFSGTGTFFEAMGAEVGGCGYPREKAVDDNGKALPFVALNTNSEFDNGANCGRWVEITLGKNCVNAGNSQWSVCNGGCAPSASQTREL